MDWLTVRRGAAGAGDRNGPESGRGRRREAARPGGGRRRPRALDRHPGAQRGADRSATSSTGASEGLEAGGRRGRDPDRRQLDRRHRRARARRAARACCESPKRGLGRAYIDALPYIRGEWILMGDADCTYDFRRLAAVRRALPRRLRVRHGLALEGLDRAGRDAGAAPATSGRRSRPGSSTGSTPATSPTSTAACAASRRDALERMDLHSQSWEYASEMVLKSVHMELRTTEVPVTFLKDREGRLSHHKRSGWFSPWQAAWINLRAMFVYGADFFLFKPGMLLLRHRAPADRAGGFGDVDLGPVTLSLNWQFLGLVLRRRRPAVVLARLHRPGAVRLHRAQRAALAAARSRTRARCSSSRRSSCSASRSRPARRRPTSATSFALGARRRRREPPRGHRPALAIAGVQLFVFTLLLHGAVVATTRPAPRRRASHANEAWRRHEPRGRDDVLRAGAPAVTPVDRFGVWLSSRRRPPPRRRSPARLADFGCGYDATLRPRSSADGARRSRSSTSRSPPTSRPIRRSPRSRARCPDALAGHARTARSTSSLCLSVLEHLWEPQADAAASCAACSRPAASCSSTCRPGAASAFLEFSAFRLGVSPAEEMDDHKRYYDPRDLWPMLVAAGFRPQRIRVLHATSSASTPSRSAGRRGAA